MEELLATWITGIPGFGSVKISKLLEKYGSLSEIFYLKDSLLEEEGLINEKERQEFIKTRNLDRIKNQYEQMKKEGIQFTYLLKKDYPKRLKNIASPPFGIFYKGSIPKDTQPVVAVVGARNATHAGKEIAGRLGRELAENGISVISGLARGVDIAAQNGVLSVAGGRTYGVLGCGIDQCYPLQHIESYTLMQENGGVLSEYPPGMPPLARNFPLRNRIISGFSDGILVIEAGKKSGSLITAEMGLEQGKDIFVVPGDIYNPCYEGSNQLIQNGAALVTKTRDILDGLGIFLDEDVSQRKKKCEVMLETTEKIVYSYLGLEPIHLSEIVKISGFPVQSVMSALVSMELKGVVKDTGNQYYAVVL